MKKHVYASLLICGLLVGLAASAQAQSKIRVNVPFDFTIGSTLLPAGEYTVLPASQNAPSEVLLVRDADGRARAVTMGIRIEPDSKATEAKLVFHRYGDQYFLSQIWLNAGEAGSEMVPGSHERELARASMAPQAVAVLAKKR
ncbi:MAG: hypothetical protein L0Z53_20235 [Acidobacteriales bacterium]|nr:hypothetical protein [Terriglobales bacterium]